jgi:hypothetical protein
MIFTPVVFRGEQSKHRIYFVPGTLRGEASLSKTGGYNA